MSQVAGDQATEEEHHQGCASKREEERRRRPFLKFYQVCCPSDFCSFLETRFGGPGGAGRAWRVAMDVKAPAAPAEKRVFCSDAQFPGAQGNGALTLFEFGSGCRAVGQLKSC